MTALGIEVSTRDTDRFYWPAPSTHGKSGEYLEVSNRIETLWARYIRLCDVEPMPMEQLAEIEDEIKRLEKEKVYLFKRDQHNIAILLDRSRK